MAKGKVIKKKKNLPSGRVQYTMRLVTSDRCVVCPTPCLRGLRYAERMSQPGEIGKGVPCILTRTKIGGD
ncbi:hypothetical protein [Paenibacillus marinisediminis]